MPSLWATLPEPRPILDKDKDLMAEQPGDGGAAEWTGRWLQCQGCRVGLAVAAQRQCAHGAHLVPAVLHLHAARLLQADAAQLGVVKAAAAAAAGGGGAVIVGRRRIGPCLVPKLGLEFL